MVVLGAGRLGVGEPGEPEVPASESEECHWWVELMQQ